MIIHVPCISTHLCFFWEKVISNPSTANPKVCWLTRRAIQERAWFFSNEAIYFCLETMAFRGALAIYICIFLLLGKRLIGLVVVEDLNFLGHCSEKESFQLNAAYFFAFVTWEGNVAVWWGHDAVWVLAITLTKVMTLRNIQQRLRGNMSKNRFLLKRAEKSTSL